MYDECFCGLLLKDSLWATKAILIGAMVAGSSHGESYQPYGLSTKGDKR